MADSSRIEDLRRRIQKDPTSIAFAQLGEEYRRARRYREAVEVCRAGLAVHPAYLSARVTLGRALAPAAHGATRQPGAPDADASQARAIQTIAALDQWLAATHVARADRHS